MLCVIDWYQVTVIMGLTVTSLSVRLLQHNNHNQLIIIIIIIIIIPPNIQILEALRSAEYANFDYNQAIHCIVHIRCMLYVCMNENKVQPCL